MDIAANFAKATVSDGNYDASDTEITLAEGGGLRFPNAPFNVVWWNATDYPDPSDDPAVEIVRVTVIDEDILTITRAQEGTAAHDHNIVGKTYKMLAGLTAKVINEDVLGIVRVGDNIEISSEGNIALQPIGNVLITPSGALFEAATGLVLRLNASLGQASLGDVDLSNSGVAFIADDVEGHLLLRGPLATDQIVSASGPVGTVAGKVALRDDTGTIIGYLPVYDSIT